MRFPATITALSLAGFAILVGATPASATLVCNPMKFVSGTGSIINNQLKGQWKFAYQDMIPLVCTITMNNTGLIAGASPCSGPLSSGSGTISGAIVVDAQCKVSGTIKIGIPWFSGFPRTYTLDGALHEGAGKSGSIMMGDAVGPTHHGFFSMIQTTQ